MSVWAPTVLMDSAVETKPTKTSSKQGMKLDLNQICLLFFSVYKKKKKNESIHTSCRN